MAEPITVKIENEILLKTLSRLKNRLHDMAPIMQAVSERMLSAVQENFLTEGKNLGEKWTALYKAHQQYRQKKRYTPIKILSMTGMLMTSISNAHTSNTAAVGTNLKYAAIHNLGFNGNVGVSSHIKHSRNGKSYNVGAYSRRMVMPKREFMGLSQNDLDEIFKIIENELFEVL